MDDTLFVNRLNEITRKSRLALPVPADREPSGPEIASWAAFFEACLKLGISLADPRWKRVTILATKPYTRFALSGGEKEKPDTDFRVGLQLLMSMFQKEEADR